MKISSKFWYNFQPRRQKYAKLEINKQSCLKNTDLP